MAEIRLTWKEYQAVALEMLTQKYPDLMADGVRFVKAYSDEPEGSHYDFPDFVCIKIKD